MGLFKDAVEGFVNGFMSASSGRPPFGRQQGTAVIERLCRELGWPVDERSETAIILHFADPILRIRKILIVAGEKCMSFRAWSAARMNTQEIPVELMGYLLLRNSELPNISWHLSVKDGEGEFGLGAMFIIESMDPPTFKYVCELMAQEVIAFDSKLRKAGLL